MDARPVYTELEGMIPSDIAVEQLAVTAGPVKILRASLFHADAIQIGRVVREIWKKLAK
jgi:hypothetical protein